MKISVIIPSYNDGAVIKKTIESLLEHNKNIYEIIIVDDHSEIAVKSYFPISDKKIKIIRHEKNMGVGMAFDTGVSAASGGILYLMGSDIRFDNNDSINLMSKCALDNPKSIVGCECVGVSDKLEFESVNTEKYQTMQHDMLGKRHRLLGASLLWKVTNKDLGQLHPQRKDEAYRDILQAKWSRYDRDVKSLAETQCVHGATYAVTKEWYDHIKGFEGHRIWGGLEPMISIKSYLAGGNCLVMGDVYTGHIFGRSVDRASNINAKYFNKFYMAYMYFDKPLTDALIKHALVWRPSFDAKYEILKNWKDHYSHQRKYYDKIFTKDVRDTILWESYITEK